MWNNSLKAKSANSYNIKILRLSCKETIIEVKLTISKSYCLTFYKSALRMNNIENLSVTLKLSAFNVITDSGLQLGIPCVCSASDTFIEMQTDDFYAIIRKKIVSLLQRTRNSFSSILKMFSNKLTFYIYIFYIIHFLLYIFCGTPINVYYYT